MSDDFKGQLMRNPGFQVFGDGRSEFEWPVRHGMKQPDRVGMEQLAGNPHGLPETRRMFAVDGIPYHGIPQVRHVDSDLVGASCFE